MFSCCFGSFFKFVIERVNELHELIVDALFKATSKRNLQIRLNFKGSPHKYRLKETVTYPFISTSLKPGVGQLGYSPAVKSVLDKIVPEVLHTRMQVTCFNIYTVTFSGEITEKCKLQALSSL